MNRLKYSEKLLVIKRYSDLFRQVGKDFYFRNTSISMNKLYFNMISPTDVLIDDTFDQDYDGNILRMRVSVVENEGLILLNPRNRKLSDKECEVFYRYNINIQPNSFALDECSDLKYDRVQIMRKLTIKNIIND